MAKEEVQISEMDIYSKLSKIRKLIEVVRKDKSGYNYKYVPEESVLAKITYGMEKYNVSLIPRINEGSASVELVSYENTKTTRNGDVIKQPVNEYVVKADMTYTWVNNDDKNQKIVVPWFLVGSQTDPSQAYGSGLTYSNRYFLLKYFQVATTEDDPDNWRQKQAEAAKIEDAAICKDIVAKIGEKVAVITDNGKNEEMKTKITEFMKAHVVINGKASANYTKITNPEVAAKVLQGLTEMEGK